MTKEQIRKSTDSENVIFWDGQELPTTKSGAINSAGGVVLWAFIPQLARPIQHRSNDNYGRKGFTFADENFVNVRDIPALPAAIRSRLEYKYSARK